MLALVAGGCERKPEEPLADRLKLSPVPFSALPGWTDDRVAEAIPALRRTCDRFEKLEPGTPVGPEGFAVSVADWRPICARAANQPSGEDTLARMFFEEWFQAYTATNNDRRDGLYTGYYEVELDASRTPAPDMTVPIYRRPSDLVTVDLADFSDAWKGQHTAGRVVDGRLRPYDDRATIESGSLAGKNLELLWAADPVEVFFLHIQGSGRVKLPDGSFLRIGYDGQNGRPYNAIGRELIERNAIKREDVSLQSIRKWLKTHPEEAAAVMNRNPSYIFFRELDDDGPMGSEGVKLTPGRSFAVDHRFHPYGTLVWLDAEDPVNATKRLRRLLIAQDSGSGVRGPLRGDVFWGTGLEAEEMAGRMKSRGEMYVLLPRSVTRVTAK